MNDIKLRPVESSDSDLLFKWSNDPITRKNSYNSNEIIYENHVSWFHKNLSKNWYIFFNQENVPIGIVRFDSKNDEWTIGICVDPNQRGKGYASKMIKEAVNEFSKNHTDIKIIAYIKEENLASRKAFINAGFSDDSFVSVSGFPSYKMVYSKN